MFCYQCEQTAKGQACTTIGVCGKNQQVAALQDMLICKLRELSQLVLQTRKTGIENENVDIFTVKTLFTTLTNVNFDPEAIVVYLKKAEDLQTQLETQLGIKIPRQPIDVSIEKLTVQNKKVEINANTANTAINSDLQSLQHLLTYGIKGVAAYTYHAYLLGKKDDIVFNFIHQGLAAPLDKSLGINDFVELVFKCGEVNIRAMELLDFGNTETYGHPVPTKVSLGVKQGKAILVSGHDLADLEEILKQSQNKGIYVYTHGEMLSAHGYPKLKAYSHFYGHYGTAWFNQQKEFANFPGAIVMTTNCIQQPTDIYSSNMFTTGSVGYPGIKHIEDKNFAIAIQKALELPGFSADTESKIVMVGFGRNAVLTVADKVIQNVKDGHIKRFLLVGGCDGAKSARGYYTELVEKAPKDTVILTLACGKFRFFDKDLGAINEIPRLLDIGQCNDAYSAIKIAQALADTFHVKVNDLPLSMVLSWYEQKAIAILLSLLYLGIKNIRIGPSLPAFITPNILKILIDKFNIMPIKTANEDLKEIMK
jgi:hydroxylamine reductase